MPSPYTPATSQLLRRKQAAEYLGVSVKQFASLGIFTLSETIGRHPAALALMYQEIEGYELHNHHASRKANHNTAR